MRGDYAHEHADGNDLGLVLQTSFQCAGKYWCRRL